MQIRSIRDLGDKLSGKKVLVRADFNVPIENGQVKDEFKLVQQLPTIRFLLRYNARIILLTHLGRPKSDKDRQEFSVKPIATELGRILDQKVKYVDDTSGLKAGDAVGNLADKGVLMLENVRFEAGEKKNDKKLAQRWADLADIYVNDAFAVCHRRHASVDAIKELMPSYAGLLLEKEISSLEAALHPEEPLMVVLGGAKLETKVPLLKRLHKKADKVLLGGALANNFLAAKGLETGKSMTDDKSIGFAKRFRSDKLILPEDVVVSRKQEEWQADSKNINRVSKDEYIFDIGPKTVKLFSHYIKKANTIIWNGPMGLYEEEQFRHGTLAIARVVATRSKGHAFGVAGGGETVDALKMTNMLEYVDWVSTGGGAMLSYLGGEEMPGLKWLLK